MKSTDTKWCLSHPDWDWVEMFETKEEAKAEKYRLQGEHITVYANDPIQVEKF
jgi:hypothetical protein|tara:strand:+ start:596 stop:754 length:159 start_codon:yes stop_codon:yes gene_type:complete